MKLLLRETGQIIGFNKKNLFLFHIGYRLATAAVYLWLLNVCMRFSLKKAGFRYLTLENAGKVLLCPWTIPILAILAGVGLFFLMVEAGGLVAAYSSAVYSLKMPAFQILLEGIRSTIKQLERKNFSLFGVVLADFFLMNLSCLYRMLTHVKPVNFVIEEMWGRPFAGAGILTAICISAAAVVPSYFVFHGCMMEQKYYRDSKRWSMEMLRTRYFKTMARVIVPQVLVIGMAMVFYLVLVMITAVFAVFFVKRDLEFAFLIQMSDKIEKILMAVVSMSASLLYFAGLTVQYYRYGKNKIGKQHFFDTGKGFLWKRNGLALLAAAGIFVGLELADLAGNGSFLASTLVVQTEITAHRGSSSSAPENTIAALMAAVEEMADWAEIDVQETADGVVILCHDTNLKRVAGVNRNVQEMTLYELQNLEVGSWFSEEYRGEKIPTLEEAMKYAKGRLKLNIELKYSGVKSSLPEKVEKLVEFYEMEEQCMITCTNLNYLKRIKEKNPHIRTGYIIPAAYGNYYMDDQVDVISLRSSFVSRKLITSAHKEGKAVHAWTVNEKKELERMRLLGVDNVITDMPILAREILYREEAAENLLEYLRFLLK